MTDPNTTTDSTVSNTHRVVVNESLPADDALQLRDHLREQADDLGIKSEVIQIE